MIDNSTRGRVEQFLTPRLGGKRVNEDDDIFDLGYVNSLFAVQLLRFVEQEFSVVLAPEDLEFKNFRTVGSIVRLVDSKAPSPANGDAGLGDQ